jgi:hypothetical protein
VIVREPKTAIDHESLFRDCEAFFSQTLSLRPRFSTDLVEGGGLEVFAIRDDPRVASALMFISGIALSLFFAAFWPKSLPVAVAVSIGCAIGIYAYLNRFPSRVVVARISPNGQVSRPWCKCDLRLFRGCDLSVARVHGFPGDMTYLYALVVTNKPGEAGLIACSQFKSFVLSLRKDVELYVEKTVGSSAVAGEDLSMPNSSPVKNN